ncbi:GDSL-type esterase/lipase family protein [Ferroacidibacillus organovorans]|uniref:SLH domain-containing protein n=1 Tax=Ferroacidibacillus organovorans TaxID=1765683 RepID=A0A853KBS0_9BACL|nr:GDSL-type esterase/lipase family protein [Ferroacidibacillus organovorans]KYP79606.1 hypothetical protein AYJ22_14085 [Ferroacidibacillus organovorans]OAG91654.1 hypothetical protein AYW79_13615 [Ferroacidibacillus organovorans]
MRLKKSLLGLASAFLTVSMISPAAFAASRHASASTQTLVALGDSIPFGYNLVPGNTAPAPQAYPYLIGKAEGMQVSDLAVPGSTSTDLLTLLTNASVQQAIKNASVVTIDTGNNDLLQLAEKDGLLTSATPKLTAAEGAQFEAAILQFGKNLPAILTTIHKLNPNARIVLYNLYNPFSPQLQTLYGLANTLLSQENAIILGDALQFNVPVANAFGAFAGNEATYIRPNDVHPTVLGQQVLASLGEQALAPASKDYQGKGAFIFELLAIMGIQPDRAGTSPFVDVPTHSFLWGYVNKAISMGLMAPDTATHFGVNDPVTEAQAAVIAAKLVNATLPKLQTPQVSAMEWALENHLFSALSPSRTMNLGDEIGFALHLKLLGIQPAATAIQIPASWQISQPAAQAFLQATLASEKPNYEQSTGTMAMKFNWDLTAAGQKDAQLKQVQSLFASPIKMGLKMNLQTVMGQIKALIEIDPISMPAFASAGGASTLTTPIHEFINGNKLYINSGKGYQPIPGSTNLQSVMNNFSLGGSSLAQLSLQSYTNVQAAQTASGYTYTMEIDQTKMTSFIDNMMSQFGGMGLPNTTNAAQMKTMMQAIFKTMQAKVQFSVVGQGPNARFSSVNEIMSIVIPANLIASQPGANASANAKVIKELKDISLNMNLSSDYAYKAIPVPTPAGLTQTL